METNDKIIEIHDTIQSPNSKALNVDASSQPRTHTLPSFIRVLEFIFHNDTQFELHYYDPIVCRDLKFEMQQPDPVIAQMPQQNHNFFELYYVKSGNLHLEINHKLHKFYPGDLYLIDLTTKSKSVYFKDLHLYVVSLSPAFLDAWPQSFEKNSMRSSKTFQFFQRTAHPGNRSIGEYMEYRRILLADHHDLIASLFQNIIDEIKNKAAGYSYFIYGTIMRLINEIENAEHYRIFEQDTQIYAKLSPAEQVDTYLMSHKCHLTISEIAKFLHYNPLYLSRVYRKEKHTTIQATNRLIYLEEARHLLADTDMSLEQIMLTLRFVNRTNFNNIFKANFGMLPLEYRKENKKE